MHKLVIDTCVFIEGFFSIEETSSKKMFTELDNNNSKVIFSMGMIGELLYIIKKKCNHIGMSKEDANEILSTVVTMFYNGKSINTRNTNSPSLAKDVDDQMFIDAAYESKATHIITLDKKSGILKLTDVPFLCVTPEDYLIPSLTFQINKRITASE